MLRKFSVGLVCALAIVACSKTIDGILTNTESLTFNVKKKAAVLPAGKWESALKFASKKEVKLQVEVPGQKKALEVLFKIPKGSPLPEENGTFELDSKFSGQPYDVAGNVKTTHVDSEEKWGWESCTYSQQRQECRYDQYGRPYCYWVTYQEQGQREVRYFVRDTTQEVNFNLLSLDKTRTAASFKGIDRSNERVYTYNGICR